MPAANKERDKDELNFEDIHLHNHEAKLLMPNIALVNKVQGVQEIRDIINNQPVKFNKDRGCSYIDQERKAIFICYQNTKQEQHYP